MEIEADERTGYGNKRIHNRLGGGGAGAAASGSDKSNRVCFHWQAGRCNRHPCPFLHSDPGTSSASSKRQNLVWQNPNSNGGYQSSNWGKGRGSRFNNGGASSSSKVEKLCKNIDGNCPFGERCRYLHTWSVGEGFSLITPLQGHQKVITGIALPSGSDKLYSGSKDETVKMWDCQTGQCAATVTMGGEVGCMINEGPWLFVGIPNSIKVWNVESGHEMVLAGPTGQVYALAVGNGMLFAGTQDGRILAYRFNELTNNFEPAAALEGHRLPVISLVFNNGRLYSGSMDKTVKVWDLTSLQCVQTLLDHTNVVMALLWWDQFLLSCSLDNTVKIWVTNEAGQMEVTYTHTEEHGVVALCGIIDAQSKPVLLCSLNDNSVRLYDLPSFSERGKIFSRQEVRATKLGPGGLFFTGDGTGELKVWQWTK
ncbi:hypothetical protein LUZ60_016330 [Juncus effusus]|nr:hypothetical protein LUZ60_016330 [Juncus effusus]